MNRRFVAQALFDRAKADTGSGGLYNASAPAITGWYWEQGPEAAAYPYVVVTLADDGESDTFGKSGRELTFYVHIYVTRDTTAAQTAEDTADNIAARIFGNGNPNSPTYGFHRWQTTLPSGSGMVATVTARLGGTSANDRDTVHLIETYQVIVSQE